MFMRVALLGTMLSLAACADQPATPVATQPQQPTAVAPAGGSQTAQLQQALANATPEERRHILASLTVAQCFLKNTAENTFRGVAVQTDGLEKRATTSDGVDVYVDTKVGMMVGLSEELCHVMVAGSDVEEIARSVEPTLEFGGGGKPKYQRTQDGWGTRFIGTGGQKFLSIVRADTIPGSDNKPSVSVFVVKES